MPGIIGGRSVNASRLGKPVFQDAGSAIRLWKILIVEPGKTFLFHHRGDRSFSPELPSRNGFSLEGRRRGAEPYPGHAPLPAPPARAV